MSVFVNPLKSNKAKIQEEIEQQIHNHKKDLEAREKSSIEADKQDENESNDLVKSSANKT